MKSRNSLMKPGKRKKPILFSRGGPRPTFSRFAAGLEKACQAWKPDMLQKRLQPMNIL